MMAQDQLRERLRSWLNPPDPSTNHRLACQIWKGEAAKWITQDRRFRVWKKKGALLWVRGKPGSGKTVICSAIIEDIKGTRDDRTDWIGYYYFDAKDDAKRDLRGLLGSLIIQLGDYTRFPDSLSQLYAECGKGSKQPQVELLIQCLKDMLAPQQGRSQVYFVIDGIDNCPNFSRGTSARREVLKFVDDLLRLGQPNLHICVISSPEHDIKMTLNRWMPRSRPVILHEEAGQKEDIQNYILSYAQGATERQLWTTQKKQLVTDELLKRADGNFRWISRRLKILQGSILDLIPNALEELGTAQDETFEQTLQDIPGEKSQGVLLFFQSMVAACRPLSHEELAKIFSTQSSPYDPTLIYNFPAFIVIDEKRVRFSSHYVKEFLTSNRLRTSDFGEISRYYIDEEDAHAILSSACIGVLLRLEKWMDKNNLENVPLALYAGHYWVRHTQSGKVASKNLEIMKDLFDPRNSHLEAWIRMQDVEKGQSRSIDDLTLHPSTLGATSLYYAALWGFNDLISYLVKVLPEGLKDKRGYHGTPLHAASYKGHLDAALVLLASGADVNAKANDKTPLYAAYYGGHPETMRSLLQHGADVNARDALQDTLVHRASRDGQPQVIDILINHSADVNARNRNDWTPLHWAALRGQLAATRCLLDRGATVNSQSLNKNTPLHFASIAGHLDVVEVLLENGADVKIKGERGWTPLEAARANRHDAIAGLLSTSHDGKKERKPIKRRALLVGITYSSEYNTWPQLDGPHHDVDRYQKLLINTYRYLPGDITVLKDLPEFAESSRPTRDNMIRELRALVSGAVPGDKFTFFYSGHSDQRTTDDENEESGMDEMIVTCDEKHIIDDELNEILVPLPVGCSLFAVFDTGYSGTMLDLQHYHCNNVYVPWLSKGERRTKTLHNITVRRQEMHPSNSISGIQLLTEKTIEGPQAANKPSNQSLQVDTQRGEGFFLDQPSSSTSGPPCGSLNCLPPERVTFAISESPVHRFACDGWCQYSTVAYPNVVSLSACSDFQCAWESPSGSLTTILCNYLESNRHPSYHALMTHINFKLHSSARELHEYSYNERRKARRGEGSGFGGVLDDFLEPQLSSLAKLNMNDTLRM